MKKFATLKVAEQFSRHGHRKIFTLPPRLSVMKFFVVIIFALTILPASVQAVNFPVTSPFGWRIHPISGEWKFHAGVDLGYEYGAYIGAIFDGQVVFAGNLNDGYGNQVLLYHAAIDAYTRYAHCSQLHVTAGQFVTAGQIIAQVGSTGYSTGPHLHLEYIIRAGDHYQYADPLSLYQ